MSVQPWLHVLAIIPDHQASCELNALGSGEYHEQAHAQTREGAEERQPDPNPDAGTERLAAVMSMQLLAVHEACMMVPLPQRLVD